MTVEFRLLGDVEVCVDGRLVEVGHVRQRCVLATLLIQNGRPVPVDQLVDRAWGERPPASARSTLYSYLSRLRQALSVTGVVITHRPGGYLITADPAAVDLHRFQELLTQAAAGDDVVAAARYHEALALWRGPALAMLDTPWLNTVRESLHRQRLTAELDRNDVVLRRGGHAGLVDALTAAAAEHPLDERLARQLLLALYRCGRQGDALHAFERLRRRLAEEVGADPSPPLRRLHQQILIGDPDLAVTAPTGAGPVRPRVPRQVPPLPGSFTGRARELAELDAALAPAADQSRGAALATISGIGGVGKTWLAVRWAHDNLRRFPDGQLYVNLRGFDPTTEPISPAEAVRRLLDALDVPPAGIPADADAQIALYRDLVAGRRMLIVVDNARDVHQVIPLLPGGRPTVLVTSRRPLAGLVVTHGARTVSVGVLREADAYRLLTRHLGAGRMAAEPESVATLLRHCSGLPLALAIVGARAAVNATFPLAVLAEEVQDASTRLDAFDAGELAADLRAVLACSYRALPADAAQLFGMLSLAPGADISGSAAASLAGSPLARARMLLRELIAANLVQEHTPGRYRMHDLVRLYATEQARASATGAARRTALQRLLDHYLHTAHAASLLLDPHHDLITPAPQERGVVAVRLADAVQALAWFSTERAVLIAAVEVSGTAGFDVHTWQLAWTLATFLDRRGHWHDRITVGRAAVAATERLADRSAQAHTHRCLALGYIRLGCYADAHAHLRRALALFGDLGDHVGQAHIHRSTARAFARQGDPRQALPHDEQALVLYRASGHRAGQATTLNAIGWHHTRLGRHAQALTYCRRALTLHQGTGDLHGQALTSDSLGYAHHHLGHHGQSIACYEQALELFRSVGDRFNEGTTLSHLGDTYHAAGRVTAARTSWHEALTILDELAHPDAESTRAKLATMSDRQVA